MDQRGLDFSTVPHFDGETYSPNRDHERLAPLLIRQWCVCCGREFV